MLAVCLYMTPSIYSNCFCALLFSTLLRGILLLVVFMAAAGTLYDIFGSHPILKKMHLSSAAIGVKTVPGNGNVIIGNEHTTGTNVVFPA